MPQPMSKPNARHGTDRRPAFRQDRGRPARDGKRELVIGRDSRGYMTLYRYVASIDTVFVLSIRSRNGQGYKCQDYP